MFLQKSIIFRLKSSLCLKSYTNLVKKFGDGFGWSVKLHSICVNTIRWEIKQYSKYTALIKCTELRLNHYLLPNNESGEEVWCFVIAHITAKMKILFLIGDTNNVLLGYICLSIFYYGWALDSVPLVIYSWSSLHSQINIHPNLATWLNL